MQKLIIAISPAIIAAIVTYFTVVKNIFSPLKIKVANNQLYKVYLPLFTFIEPYLFEHISIDVLTQFLDIFKDIKSNHYELIDSNLLNEIQILEKSIKDNKYSYESYESVCRTLDKLFESTRRYLKLPTRNFYYKINNKQFNNSFKDFYLYFKDSFVSSLPVFALMFFFSIIYLLTIRIFNIIESVIR